MPALFRLILRLTGVLLLLVLATGSYWLATNGKGPDRLPIARARWLRRNCARMLRIIGVRLHGTLRAPAGSLVVCNHLGYLDILVLAAQQPMVFVSKSEVRHWPVVGWFVAKAGTVFLERQKRSAVGPAITAMQAPLSAGIPVAVFPEGTTSNGSSVLPFHSSLLAPAENAVRPVAAVALRYHTPARRDDPRVCYWNNDTFLPHFLRLLALPRVDVQLAAASLEPLTEDRKQLRHTLHAEVSRLHTALAA